MQPSNPHNRRDNQSPKALLQRLDRLAGDMNAFLLLLALGLAGLDFGCFVALKIAQMPVTYTRSGQAVSGMVSGAGTTAAAVSVQTTP